jgi:hypothetical protein
MSAADYEQVLEGLPDNNTGAIQAANVRSILESVTPAFFVSDDQDGLTVDAPDGVWADLPFDGTINRSDEFAPSPGCTYVGDARRIATIRAYMETTGFQQFEGEFQLCHETGPTDIQVLATGQLVGGMLGLLGSAVISNGSEILLRFRQTTVDPSMTVDISKLYIEAIGHLAKTPALVQNTPA